ncbi:MAG: PTS fructose-like transporter subunit IIB [Longimicrobiaceae bacterium]
MKIVAVTASSAGPAIALMAAEALKRTAEVMGHSVRAETQDPGVATEPLSEAAIAAADVVILATDARTDGERFAGRPVHEVRTADAIRHTRAVLDAALALVSTPSAVPVQAPSPAPVVPAESASDAPAHGGKRIVGITACPTGIAHTFMAAEALQKAARAMGHEIKVETQGSVGAKNQLSPEDIAAADAVVIAADTQVDTSRFGGKPVYVTSTKQAIKAGQEVIGTALAQPAGAASGPSSATTGGAASAETAKSRSGPYKHLMTGVSYMLPVVIAGGLCIALAFALGGIYAGEREGTLAFALNQVGGGAFRLFVAVFSGFIAYSIADRPGLAPGLVGGLLAQEMGAGFLGGIASGFLAGYLTRFLAQRIRLPATLEGLKPVLVLPLLATLAVGLGMIYVIAPPTQALNGAMNGWLLGMRGANAALLGLVLGAMMAVDMGGPLNKAAYTFGVGLLASRVDAPMAAVMAAGMTPPLGLAVAAFLFRGRFGADERRAGGPAFVLGLAFITEGAIPFAAKDPLRVIPALVLGSATAGAVSMAAGARLLVPHGGIFAALIPGAVTQLPAYLGAIAAGTAVTAAALFVLKRRSPAVDDAGIADAARGAA